MELKKHILNLLNRIGLTESEAKFYLAVYQNPNLTISELKKICGISLASSYRAFENLKEKKLLTSSQENWRKNIEAVSLRTIGQKLASESLKLRKVEYELKKLENLMNLTNYQETEEPVEIFSDQNQISDHCYKLINADWNHIFCYGSAENFYAVGGEKPVSDFVSMRSRKGKTIDAVFTTLGEHTRELLKNNQQELRNGKLLIDPLNQNVMAHIYDKQVTIWQNDAEVGKRAIVINDPGLIKMYTSNFKKMWASV